MNEKSHSTQQRSGKTAYVARITEHGARIIRHLPPFIFFFPLLFIFFHKMALSNLILARGDTFLYFYPYWQMAAAALRDGRIPLWNPHLFMGSPFLANSQAGFFYPLNWPVWLLLETPYAVSASILLHLAIGGMGAYLAARKVLALAAWASVVTAVLFALGGYVTAQVEHINQLQGIAWLPWYFVVMGWGVAATRSSNWLKAGWCTIAFAMLLALQLLAGHSQTVFISGCTLLLWLAAEFASHHLLRHTEYGLPFTFRWRRLQGVVPLALVGGGGLALLLAAGQLLPTLELAQQSSRQGGLSPNEVLSFSLHPLLLTRALLPAYGQVLFSEYIAFMPLTAVILALIGAWQWRRWPGVFPAIILVGAGLFLALGAFNPANWLLARLPIFDLFRVPARWLLMATWGMALLAGAGFQVAVDRHHRQRRRWQDVPARAKRELVHIRRPLRTAIFVLIGLMLWNTLAGFLAFFIPTGPEAPFEGAPPMTLLLWLVEILLVYGLLTGERVVYARDGRFKIGVKRSQPRSVYWLLPLMFSALFLASRTHPYNNLTTPEAYFDLRPSIARLQVAGCHWPAAGSRCLPDRFLSLSHIFFDVGDQGEIDTIYADQLTEDARYDYTVAIKHKEIIGPNLSMAFGLAAVDGFDGGILPLRAYTELMRLLLAEGEGTTDGRLREHLTAVPAARWLDLFNARYLITDKTGDVWRSAGFMRQAVSFDLQHRLDVQQGESFSIAYLPAFPATALVMLVEGEPGVVEFGTTDGEKWLLEPVPMESGMVGVQWPPAARPRDGRAWTLQSLTIHAAAGDWQVLAATLINQEDDTFMPLTLGNYRLIYSGDVKIYENLDVLPRAFMVHAWQWQPDVAASVAAMREAHFDPAQTAFVAGDSFPPSGDQSPTTSETQIIHYAPEQLILQTASDADGLLLLTEAFYPGWQATIDGQSTPIYQANAYFQGVFVPAGEHEVSFMFMPRSWEYGRNLTFTGLFLLAVLGATLLWRRQMGKR